MWGVFGLGNPGARYAATRHNVGFLVVERLAARAAVAFRRHEGYESAAIEHAGVPVVLVKPRTYVNRSGSAARVVLENYGLTPGQLLVVVDDVHLPFGRLRLRPEGSAGGHNGLISIETALQTRTYPRLRLGVGGPESSADLVEHVLGPWTEAELEALPALVERAAAAVETVVALGVDAARPQVNATPPA